MITANELYKIAHNVPNDFKTTYLPKYLKEMNAEEKMLKIANKGGGKCSFEVSDNIAKKYNRNFKRDILLIKDYFKKLGFCVLLDEEATFEKNSETYGLTLYWDKDLLM